MKATLREGLRAEFDHYTISPSVRHELLIRCHFSQNPHNGVWNHIDGRSCGDGVIMALCDEAFLRFIEPNKGEENAKK